MSEPTNDAASTMRRRSPWRYVRLALLAGVVVLIVGGIYSATSLFWAVQGVRQDVDAATAAVKSGDISGAATAVTELTNSSSELADVTSSFTWSVASRLPVIGSTISGLNVMASAVSSVAAAAEPVLTTIGGAGSTTKRVAALGNSEPALMNLASSIEAATAALGAVEPSTLRFGLDEHAQALQDALPQAAELVAAAADASKVLPRLLGMDGRRVWMVLLQNPAEARGSGGLFSGYALVEMVDGQPTILEAETRKTSLDEFSIDYVEAVTPEVAALWGPALGMWASFNLSADFTTVGSLAAAGMAERGTPVDGVIALDAFTVQALLSGTGSVEHRGVTIDGTNAADFFTKDLYAQYPDFPDVEAKDELALGLVYATIDSLLKRPLDLATLLDTIPPVVDSGHIQAWSPDPVEQAWFLDVGLAGDIASRDPSTIVVSLNNSTGGKLDAYVTPSMTYISGICQVTTGPSAGQRRSALEVTLTNDAPSGLPEYVDVRLDDPTAPAGSTRTQVYVYGPDGADLREIYLDDTYPPPTIGRESGRPVWGTGAEVLQGQTTTVTFIFDEPFRSLADPAVVLPGSAIPAEITVVEANSTLACPTAAEDMPTREELAALVAGKSPS